MPGLGDVAFDIAFSGIFIAVVAASAVGLDLEEPNVDGAFVAELGRRVSAALRKTTTAVHPENHSMRGVTNVVFRGPVRDSGNGRVGISATVVLPGRLDRSPRETGTCAQLAILYAKGQIDTGEHFTSMSVLGTKFDAYVSGTTMAGGRPAVKPVVKGRAWITGFQPVVLDPEDPFPQDFRLSDAWVKEEPLQVPKPAEEASG